MYDKKNDFSSFPFLHKHRVTWVRRRERKCKQTQCTGQRALFSFRQVSRAMKNGRLSNYLSIIHLYLIFSQYVVCVCSHVQHAFSLIAWSLLSLHSHIKYSAHLLCELWYVTCLWRTEFCGHYSYVNVKYIFFLFYILYISLMYFNFMQIFLSFIHHKIAFK
jgi:hypothetical protein